MLSTPYSCRKLLLADDHVIVRDGLRAILEDEGFEVVGEASDGLEGYASVRALVSCKLTYAIFRAREADRSAKPARKRS